MNPLSDKQRIACVYRTGCETPNDCREHGYCRSPKNAAAPEICSSAQQECGVEDSRGSGNPTAAALISRGDGDAKTPEAVGLVNPMTGRGVATGAAACMPSATDHDELVEIHRAVMNPDDVVIYESDTLTVRRVKEFVQRAFALFATRRSVMLEAASICDDLSCKWPADEKIDGFQAAHMSLAAGRCAAAIRLAASHTPPEAKRIVAEAGASDEDRTTSPYHKPIPRAPR